MRKIIMLIALCFLVFSCELFNAQEDPDFWDKLDEEIAWANAEKLTVSVTFPAQWGTSPNSGTGRSFDNVRTDQTPRKGYAFTVEFSPLPGFGFEQWLAFPTSEYAGLDMSKSAADVIGVSLNDNGVEITENTSGTGARTATVTVNTSVPVTLVPWCSNRPALSQETRPPLIPMQSTFPRNQTVRLVFNMNIEPSTVEGNIKIMGSYYAGDKYTMEAGDNGDITDYFKIEYTPDNEGKTDRVNLVPKTGDPDFDWTFLSINVIVGPDIKNTTGQTMIAQEVISYMTDAGEAQKAYTTTDIQAKRSSAQSEEYFQDRGTTWNNPNIDRRFNNSDKKTVYLRFQVIQPAEVTLPPNRFSIVEQMYADLGGFSYSASAPAFPVPQENINRDGVYYEIEYDLQLPSSGIIRLIVLPSFYEDNDPQNQNNIPVLNTQEAVAIGQYVTVVKDVSPPALQNLGAVISGWNSTKTENDYVFGVNSILTLTLNRLNFLNDNGSFGGIPASAAWNRPWTMDDLNHLKWQVTATADSGEPHIITSPWLEINTGTGSDRVFDVNIKDGYFELTDGIVYTLSVSFIDRMGNVSVPVEAGKVQRLEGTAEAVTDIRAVANPAGNQITVSFKPPDSSYQRLELVVKRYRSASTGDVLESENSYTNFESFSESGVSKLRYSFSTPEINTRNVRSGEAVSNVYGYELTVITHTVVGEAETGQLWVYNIPGMATAFTTQTTEGITYRPALRITTDNMANANTLLNSNFTDNIILTRNITISSRNPTGTFTGNFYGNGHTVTIKNMTEADNMGLFGTTNNALIRDLTVVYNSMPEINTSATNVGGIVGNASGDTRILNSIVRGASEADSLTYTGSGITIRIGGIAGNFNGHIENCHAALSVACNAEGSSVYIGGIAGELGTGSGGSIVINDTPNPLTGLIINGVTVTANVSADIDEGGGVSFIGGTVGRSGQNTIGDVQKTINNIEYITGNISFCFNDLGSHHIGGILGASYNTNIINCHFSGDIGTIKNEMVRSYYSYIGGLIGYNEIIINENYYITNCTVQVGTLKLKIKTNEENIFGGVIGISRRVNGQITITNTFFNKGDIIVESDGNMLLGGFIGNISGVHKIDNCGSKRETTINYKSFNDSFPFIGGFVSRIFSGNISNCFSGIDIITNNLYSVGGFTGNFQDGIIDNCYSTGTVKAVGISCYEGNHVGGFIGWVEYGTVLNCYALGDVIVDIESGYGSLVYAGGFVGKNIGNITNCFSTGEVSVQSNVGTA